MMNNIQRTFALDGATVCNIRADGFGDFMPTRECGQNGREPSAGIYMRNKMFISSMVSLAGSLALSGSASAGVMYDFSAVFDTTAVTTTDTSGNARKRAGGTLAGGLFANFEAEARFKNSQVSGAVGSVSLIAGQASDKLGIGAFTLDSGGLVDAALLVNLSGTTSFSINVNAYSGTSTVWVLEAVSMSGGLERSMTITKTGVSSAGLLTFNMIDAVYITPTGFDMSRIALVSVVMQREALGSAGSTTSASFDSFTYAVPGPGSIALLGAAGLIGTRRRRA